jgi:hypothetical protein
MSLIASNAGRGESSTLAVLLRDYQVLLLERISCVGYRNPGVLLVEEVLIMLSLALRRSIVLLLPGLGMLVL